VCENPFVRITLLALLAAASSASAAGNPYLSAAVRLYDDIEYESALEQLKKAETWPGNGPAEDVTIQLYKGLVLAELGKSDDASTAFKAALALDPKAELPGKVSPKVRGLFTAARAELARTRPAEQPKTAIRDEPAPQSESETPKPRKKASDVPTAKPPEVSVVEITAEPEANSRTRTAVVPEVVQPTNAPPAVTQPSHPWIAPVALLAGGVVVGGGGVYFGVQSSQAVQAARNEQIQFIANGHLNDARTYSWVANGMYAGAGLLAIIAGVVAIAESR
jgi:hypothetical protein